MYVTGCAGCEKCRFGTGSAQAVDRSKTRKGKFTEFFILHSHWNRRISGGTVTAINQHELSIRDARKELELATAGADKAKIFAAHQKLLEALARRANAEKQLESAVKAPK